MGTGGLRQEGGRRCDGRNAEANALCSGSPGASFEAVLGARFSPYPLPLGDPRPSILRDPRARRCAETALDQPFQTIQLAMGEDSKVIARILPRHARGLGAGLVGGECE